MTAHLLSSQQGAAALHVSHARSSHSAKPKSFVNRIHPLVVRMDASRSVSAAAAATDKMPSRPDAFGRYGKFGGKYVPETLIAALEDLEKAYADAMADEEFKVCCCSAWRLCRHVIG